MMRINDVGSKWVISFKIFIAPIAILLVCFPYLIGKNPGLTVIILVTLGIVLILAVLYLFCVNLKINYYVQKHDFQLWKKSKSASLKDRMEAAKEIKSLAGQTPCLEKYQKRGDKIAFILLTIWTLIFLGISSFIVFSSM